MPRITLPWVALLAIVAGCFDDAMPASNPGEKVASPASDLSPRVVTGELTAPAQVGAEVALRDYLREQPALIDHGDPEALALDRRWQTDAGEVVTLGRVVEELPVIGGEVTARTDPEGRLRWISARPAASPQSLSTTTPSLGADAAVDRLSRLARFADVSFEGAETSLVVFALGAHAASPRLAWKIELPLDTSLMQAPVLIADAHSGALLSESDRIRRAAPPSEPRARVFEIDPLVTPDKVEVTLDALAPGATALEDESFSVYNCVDRQECVEFHAEGVDMVGDYHFCSFEQLATPDANGDFLHIEPPSDHGEWKDAFAEVSAYHYVRHALDEIRGRLGMPDLLEEIEFSIVVNTPGMILGGAAPAECVKDDSGDLVVPEGEAFTPLENAAYGSLHQIPGMPAPLDRPALLFGQGGEIDYAYGGDIAYHEFGHAVFDAFGGRGLGIKHIPDPLGIDPSPGALDEGFADYIAFMLSGEPVLGRYVSGGDGMRSGLNDRRCPDDSTGEEHYDGEPWMGALWGIREALAEPDRQQLDAAVLRTMMGFQDELGYQATAELLLTEIEIALGEDAKALASDELDRRGLLANCDDRVRELGPNEEHDMLWAQATGPTALQFRIEVDEKTDRLELAAMAQQNGPSEPSARVHVGGGDAPIVWDWNDPEMGDHGPPSDADDRAKMEFSPVEGAPQVFSASAVVEGTFEPGIYHLQIENRGADVIFMALGSPQAGDGAGDGVEKPDCPGGGCEGDDSADLATGCQIGGGKGAQGAWLLALVLFAIAARRRRVAT